MTNKNYQPRPDAYVVFKWRDKEVEGEFFRDSFGDLDFRFGDYSKKYRGYLRPFDKELRQMICDIHMNNRGIDFEKFITVGELISCDSFVNHPELKKPYLDVVVKEFRFIKREELRSQRELIADCRVDLLRRQYLLGKSMGKSDDEMNSLEKEFKAWVAPTFRPIRYTMTNFQKFIRSRWFTNCIFIALVVMLLAGNY